MARGDQRILRHNIKIDWRTYLASRASANTPAASGAAAEVPLCVVVHLP